MVVSLFVRGGSCYLGEDLEGSLVDVPGVDCGWLGGSVVEDGAPRVSVLLVGGLVPACEEPSEDGLGYGRRGGVVGVFDLEPGDGVFLVGVGSEVGGVFVGCVHGVAGPLGSDIVGFGCVQGACGFGEFS